MQKRWISPQQRKKELWFWAGSFIVAFFMNIYSILKYKTSWSELYSQLHIVLLISLVLYGIIGIVRLIVYGIIYFIRKID